MKLKDVQGHVFSYVPDSGGDGFTVAIAMIAKWAEANRPLVLVPCKDTHADYLMEHGGVEAHRLNRLTVEDVFKNPITLLDMGDGTHVVADGNHRYIIASVNNVKWIPAYMVPFDDWQEFIIEDILTPVRKTLLTLPSGIK